MTIADIIALDNGSGYSFTKALSVLLPLEVVLAADGVTIINECVKGDSGGLTFAGIDRASHPNFPFSNPQPCDVWGAYLAEWHRISAGSLPKALGGALFIQGTNQGDERCEEMLQRVLGVAVDGVIGPDTIKAAWAADEHSAFEGFLQESRDRYEEIIARTPRDEKFEQGWLNRIAGIDKSYAPNFS